MVVHNLLSIHWTSVPCEKPLIDEMGVVCMDKTHNIAKPSNRSLSIERRPSAFLCDDGTMVSYFFIHNFTQNCRTRTSLVDNFTEKTSLEMMDSSQINDHSLLTVLPYIVCNLITELNINNFKYVCPNINRNAIKTCIPKFEQLSELTINITQKVDNVTSSHIESFCVYDPYTCNSMIGYHNGKYLLTCEEFNCKSIYFKCQGYYCIPWRIVCNGVWDCPWGLDEQNCTRAGCPGQFRCQNTSTCIAPDSICNGISDCPFGDDEYFCFPKLPTCPNNCSCVVYSILCFHASNLIFNTTVPFIHIDISFSFINLTLNYCFTCAHLPLDTSLTNLHKVVFSKRNNVNT